MSYQLTGGQLNIGNQFYSSVEGIKTALESLPDKKTREAPYLEGGPSSGFGPIRHRYERLATIRQPVLDEARRMSEAVAPFLYPPLGCSDIYSLDSANQSLVAEGVANLAYALTQTICPPSGKFFRRKVLPALAESIEAQAASLPEATQQDAASVLTRTNAALAKRDAKIRQRIQTTPDVEVFNFGMMHAQVGAEFLFFKPTIETSKLYTLENFVAAFDSSGEMVETIARDFIHPSKFSPEDLQELFGTSNLEDFDEESLLLDEIPVYTRQIRRFDHWEIQVEIAGMRFKKMEGKEKLTAPPFIVVPFFLFPNRKYGTSWCTYNKGSIFQYENQSLVMNELIKEACDFHITIPPGSKLSQKEMAKPGPKYNFGMAEPVTTTVPQVHQNMAAVGERLDKGEQELMRLFLLEMGIQRQAERQTAEEWKIMVAAVRKLLGPLYLSLARRWQHPYLGRVEELMIRAGEIPALDEGTTQLLLTAGIETLESEEEQQALDSWMSRLQPIPEAAAHLNLNEYALRVGNHEGVDLDNLWMDDSAVQAKAGTTKLMAVVHQMGPGAADQLANFLAQILKNPQAAAQLMQGGLGGAMQSPGGIGQVAKLATPPPPKGMQ